MNYKNNLKFFLLNDKDYCIKVINFSLPINHHYSDR